MTDRYHTLTVVLEQDTRTDDVDALIAAIGQMRGVLKVSGVVSDTGTHMAQVRAKHDLREKLRDLLA